MVLSDLPASNSPPARPPPPQPVDNSQNGSLSAAKVDLEISNGGAPVSDNDKNYLNKDLSGNFGWIARGNREPAEIRVPFSRPKLRQIYNALPFIRRYSMYWLKNYNIRNKLFINTFQPLKHKPYYGVPCGGIGSGSIGRDFRGGFCKFSLRPGLIEHKVDVVKANQFILTLRRDGKTFHQVVLSAVPFNQTNGSANGSSNKQKEGEAALCDWNFSMAQKDVTYRGLYPRSWTRFEVPEHNIVVVCRQVSPILPNNYKDSSLPVSVFSFSIQNNSELAVEASITFTFRNGTGNRRWNEEGRCKGNFFTEQPAQGVTLEHFISEMPCTFAIGALKTPANSLTTCQAFDPNGTGLSVWKALEENGNFSGGVEEVCPENRLGVAVCLQTTIQPMSSTSEEMDFSLVWHMPVVQFGAKKRQYKRWYSRFFVCENPAKEAAKLCEYVLTRCKQWEKEIDAWQDPILNHPNLPDWFKSALFNELYFLTDGGSLWFDFDQEWRSQETQMSDYTADLLRKYGRFGYLESWEYRMINTYDVHFYASFALAELFPNLQHALQADMKDQIDHFDELAVKYHMEGELAPKKTHKRVPHDLGNPMDDPWMSTNAYVMHDTGKWKDLNLKFILTSYRDYHSVLNCDKTFLQFVWPAIKNLIEEGLKHWDRNGDGMIENFGAADQTYDAWKMQGVSAYCGSLWLASLRVAVEMAKEVGESEELIQRFTTNLESGKKIFDEKLWNGEYYNFDEGSFCRRTIMADQLCGYWYLDSINHELAKDLLPQEHIASALKVIYENNVLKFGGGMVGAVNGMTADGKIDTAYIQADEMWTGITYALGSFFIQQGDVQRGFDVAWGCYDSVFNRSGLQFQTPEAMYKTKFYRAIGYMRPLSIWSMFTALRKQYNIFDPTSTALSHVRTSAPPTTTIKNKKGELKTVLVESLRLDEQTANGNSVLVKKDLLIHTNSTNAQEKVIVLNHLEGHNGVEKAKDETIVN
uniref:Non-lysosomal glucosylceramidase n=1 Tax=Ditylenchus dipsaci TaxID=166011 RepID=A0A915CU39_9BILA